MKTRIIVDSTADLLPHLKERVEVAPLTVRFGDKEYIDGVTICHADFYRMLEESTALPSTSQATPDSFARLYARAQEAGEAVVVITLASAFSGTYQSAVIAAAEYGEVYVVDSCSATIGSALLVELALQLRDAGADAATIAKTLEAAKARLAIVAVVDTLEFLKRGGRISKTVAFAGTMLNIKPVLGVMDGRIEMLGKARGVKQGYRMLLQQMEAQGGVDHSMPVLLGYTGVSEGALVQFAREYLQDWGQTRHTCIGSVIGTHAGPGAVAVAFFKKA